MGEAQKKHEIVPNTDKAKVDQTKIDDTLQGRGEYANIPSEPPSNENSFTGLNEQIENLDNMDAEQKEALTEIRTKIALLRMFANSNRLTIDQFLKNLNEEVEESRKTGHTIDTSDLKTQGDADKKAIIDAIKNHGIKSVDALLLVAIATIATVGANEIREYREAQASSKKAVSTMEKNEQDAKMFVNTARKDATTSGANVSDYITTSTGDVADRNIEYTDMSPGTEISLTPDEVRYYVLKHRQDLAEKLAKGTDPNKLTKALEESISSQSNE